MTLTMCLSASACGQNKQESVAGPAGEQGSRASDSAPTQVASKGRTLFLRCRSCHTLKKDERHTTGPNLHGMFGAAAGKKEGFVFSKALVSSNIVWDEAKLDAWIEQPRKLVPGNKMVFAGLPNKEERAALIEYLKEETK